MMKLKEYEPITGPQVLEELYRLAEKIKGWSIQNINSTAVGGGGAEILNRMVPLLQEMGVNARWDVIKGGEKFFKVTKKFHSGDIHFIHDPQPIGLINRKGG